MAKYCGKCGIQADDNARACGNCGTLFDAVDLNRNGEVRLTTPSQKKRKIHIKKGAGIVLAVLVLAIIFSIASNFIGVKGMVRKAMRAYKNYDINSLVKMSSDMYFYGEEDLAEAYFEYTISDDFDGYEYAVGDNFKLSYEIDRIYTFPAYKQGKILENVSSLYTDFDVSKIKKIAAAELTVTAKNDSKSCEFKLTVTLSREGNKWKLMYIE